MAGVGQDAKRLIPVGVEEQIANPHSPIVAGHRGLPSVAHDYVLRMYQAGARCICWNQFSGVNRCV